MDLAAGLQAAGHRVVTFDAPGHGASPGRLSSGVEFARAALAVARADGREPAAVVGHSLGGFAAALALARGLPAQRAVFIAPSAEIDSYTRQFAALLGVRDSTIASMRDRLERRLDFAWDELNVPALAPAMRVPLLVVHDRHDPEVPWSAGAAITAAWPGAVLVTTDGLGHHRIVSDRAVVARVRDFLHPDGVPAPLVTDHAPAP